MYVQLIDVFQIVPMYMTACLGSTRSICEPMQSCVGTAVITSYYKPLNPTIDELGARWPVLVSACRSFTARTASVGNEPRRGCLPADESGLPVLLGRLEGPLKSSADTLVYGAHAGANPVAA